MHYIAYLDRYIQVNVVAWLKVEIHSLGCSYAYKCCFIYQKHSDHYILYLMKLQNSIEI